MYGNTEVCSYDKLTNLSQVPGFTYQMEPLLDLPRPIEWTPQAICKTVLQSIKIGRSSRFKIIYGSDDLLIQAANQKNPKYERFTSYCREYKVYWAKDIKTAHVWIGDMYADEIWHNTMNRHLKYRRSVEAILDDPDL